MYICVLKAFSLTDTAPSVAGQSVSSITLALKGSWSIDAGVITASVILQAFIHCNKEKMIIMLYAYMYIITLPSLLNLALTATLPLTSLPSYLLSQMCR